MFLRKYRWLSLLALFVGLSSLLIVTSLSLIPSTAPSDSPLPTVMQLSDAPATALPPDTAAPDQAAPEAKAQANIVPVDAVRSASQSVSQAQPVVYQPPQQQPPAATIEPQRQLPPPEPIPNQIIIQFAPNSTTAERQQYIQSLGATVTQDIAGLNTVVLSVPASVDAQRLSPSSILTLSEPDYQVVAQQNFPVNDPYYPEQWALPAIGAPDAWAAMPADAQRITVAVIDSGVCLDHPDLVGRILPGYDFVDDDNQASDSFGHGCGVAGIIAANGNNGIGIAGVAPNAMILPLRVLDAQGIGAYSDVAAAIVFAADNGAQVINLSLGGAFPSTVLESAVNYAVERGVTVVAAAGNTGSEQILYPAAYAPVIAVGAIDSALQTSSFSARGAGVDIWAPGQTILTTTVDGSHATSSGTSFAAPYVAGVVSVQTARGQQVAMGGLLALGGSSGGEMPVPTQIVVVPTGTPIVFVIESVDFDSIVKVPDELRTSVVSAITSESRSLATATHYYASAFSISDDRLWARVVLAPDYIVENGWENINFDVLIEVLARRTSNEKVWQANIYDKQEYESLANIVPQEFIDFSAGLLPQATRYQFPWTNGYTWWKNGGFHTGYWGLPNYAIDFQAMPNDRNPTGAAVLAASSGLLQVACGPDSRNQLWYKITNSDGTTGYGHLDATAAARNREGQQVVTGQFLAVLFSLTADYPNYGGCGYGSKAHLHFVFPNTNIEMYSSHSEDLRWIPYSELAVNTGNGNRYYTSTNVRVDGGGGSNCQNYSASGVVLFRDSNCGGATLPPFTNERFVNLPDQGNSWNDGIYSVWIPSNWSVRVWSDDWARGESVCFNQSKWDLRSTNDRYENNSTIVQNGTSTLSSLQIFPGSNNCAVTNMAQVQSQSVDISVQTGQSFSTYVEIHNSGTSVWRPGQVVLQKIQGTSGSPNQISLIADRPIVQGEVYRWNINQTAPMTTGSNPSRWRMSIDGSQFGPEITFNINVSSPPQCSEMPTQVRLYDTLNCVGTAGWQQDPPSVEQFYDIGSSYNDRLRSIAIPLGYSVRLYVDIVETSASVCIADTDGDLTDNFFQPGNIPVARMSGNPLGETSSFRVYNNNTCTSVVPTAPTLTTPTNNWMYDRNTQVTLNWNPATNAAQYRVEITTPLSGTLPGSWNSSTSLNFGSSQGAGTYTWRVQARNSQNAEGPWSETRTFYIRYGAPAALTAITVSPSQINLSWNASVDAPINIDGYRIYRGSTAIATVGNTTTIYSDNGVSCGSTYGYTVRAYKGDTESPDSNNSSATVSSCAPAAPGAPTLVSPSDITIVSRGQFTSLSWSAVSGAIEYEVELRSTGGNVVIASGWAASNSWVTGFTHGGEYMWRARARNSGGTGPWSSTRLIYYQPAPPSNVQAAMNGSAVNVTWTAAVDLAANLQDYRIARTGGSTSNIIANNTTTAYMDTNVTCGTTYAYTILSNAYGATSDISNSATVTTPACPPPNDLYTNATDIETLPYNGSQEVFASTLTSDEPTQMCGEYISNLVWYRYTSPSDRNVTVSTMRSSYDTVVGVYTSPANWDGSMVGCNDRFDVNNQSQVSFIAYANIPYFIGVADWNPTSLDSTTTLLLDVFEDSTSPTGRMLLPIRDTFSSSNSILMSAQATDNNGGSGVKQVEFYAWADNTWSNQQWIYLGGDTSAPYEWNWDMTGIPDGIIFISAMVSDHAGNGSLIWDPDWTILLFERTVPTSNIGAVPAQSSFQFNVNWTGTDNWSGIDNYDIQVSTNNGAWTDWLTSTTATTALFIGSENNTYAFRSRARDRAGNVEVWPAVADTMTQTVPPPSNDDQVNPIVISHLPYSNSQSMLGATNVNDGEEMPCPTIESSHVVWYQFTVPFTQQIIVDTIGSQFDTVLGVFNGTAHNLTRIACNDDGGGDLTSRIVFDAVAATSYFIGVGNYSNNPVYSQSQLVLNVYSTVNNPPIASAGSDQTVVDSDRSGSELVRLDGSDSTDSDGSIINYRWLELGSEIATGANPQVDFAVGTHEVTLIVTDDGGAQATDIVTVIIQANTLNWPVLQSPENGAFLKARSVNFAWQNPAVTGQTGYGLRIGTSADPNGTGWLVNATLGNSTLSYGYTFASDSVYYWHMRTLTNSGNSGWVTRQVTIDTVLPVASITSPKPYTFITNDTLTINVSANDVGSGVTAVQFYVGYANTASSSASALRVSEPYLQEALTASEVSALGWEWHEIGWDLDGSDGWSQIWNASGVPEQTQIGVFIYAYDKANNSIGVPISDVILSRSVLGIGSYDERHSSILYTSGAEAWVDYNGTGPYNNTMRYTGSPKAYLAFRFSGYGFALYRTMFSGGGALEVCVNNTPCYPVVSDYVSTVWNVPYPHVFLGSGGGSHTVVIRNTSGRYIGVEGIQILPATSPLPAVGTYPETDANILYLGNWESVNDPAALGGTRRVAKQPFDQAIFMFSGKSLTLYRTLGPAMGTMDLCVDSRCQEVVNTSANARYGVPFTVGGLSSGTHIVSISNRSARPGDIDAIAINNDPLPLGVGLYSSMDPNILYSGNWLAYTSSDAIGSVLRYSNDLNATASFQFTGNNLTLYRTRFSSAGAMKVCIDAQPCQTVDNYQLALQWAAPVTFSNLGSGTHQVVISNLSGNYIGIEAVQVRDTSIPLAAGLYQETDPSVSYTGSWISAAVPQANGGSILYTNTSGAEVRFTIASGSFTLYYARFSGGGNMDVCIDSLPCRPVNQGNGELQWQVTQTFDNLGAGPHQVILRNSGSTYSVIDAIEVRNSQPILTAGKVQETDPAFIYNGYWINYAALGPEGGSARYTNMPDAEVKFRIATDSFTLHYTRFSGGGTFDVCIDMNPCQPLSTDAATLQWNVVQSFDNLGAGPHQVILRNRTAAYVILEAITVRNMPIVLTAGTYQDDNPAITYNGSWISYAGVGPSGGSLRYSVNPGDDIRFRISGQSLKLTMLTASSRAPMSICIDAQPCQPFITSTPSLIWGSTVTLNNLGPGVHQIIIRHTGTTGQYIDLDAVEVIDVSIFSLGETDVPNITETEEVIATASDTVSPTPMMDEATATPVVTADITSTPVPTEVTVEPPTVTVVPTEITPEQPPATSIATDVPAVEPVPTAIPTPEPPTADPTIDAVPTIEGTGS